MNPIIFALPACLLLGTSAPACDEIPDGLVTTGARTLTLRASGGNDVVVETLDADGAPLVIRAASILITDLDGAIQQTLALDAAGRVRLLAPTPRVRIGVTTEPIGQALAAQLAIDTDAIVITDVSPGLPAAAAGVERFDIVTHIDGTASVTQERLREAVRARRAGEHIVLRVVRHAKPLDLEIRVAAADDSTGATDLLSSYEGYLTSDIVQLADRPYLIDLSTSVVTSDIIAVPTVITAPGPTLLDRANIDLELLVPPIKIDITDVPGAGPAPSPDPICGLRAELATLEAAVARIKALLGELARAKGG